VPRQATFAVSCNGTSGLLAAMRTTRDMGSEHVAVGAEKRLELKIGWSEPCPLEVEERGEPGAERRVASGIQDVGVGSTPATRFRYVAAIESRFWAGFRITSCNEPRSPRDTAAAYD
jgi:hypothetical protein